MQRALRCEKVKVKKIHTILVDEHMKNASIVSIAKTIQKQTRQKQYNEVGQEHYETCYLSALLGVSTVFITC